MGKKLTHEEVKNILRESGYILIGDYINNRTNITFKDNEGYIYQKLFTNFNRSRLSKFHKSNVFTIYNIKIWCELNNKLFKPLSKNFIGASVKLQWLCYVCGEIFENSWGNISQGQECPFCVGKQVSLLNCLATKNPELASEWHHTKNGDLTPFDVTSGSKQKVWWQCEKLHEWQAIIYSRMKGNNCPYCRGLYPSKDNNLLSYNPDLCNQWNYNKNIKDPSEYTSNSDKKVWWLCDKGHEWEAKISQRNVGNGCPYCSGKFPTNENNLLVSNPLLCEEWNYIRNIKTPNEYTVCSGQKVWWKCKNCEHEWKAAISNRTKGRGCPKCCKSKGETIILEYLETKNIYYSTQYRLKECKDKNPLPFDFAIFEDSKKTKLKMLIEYDGELHYIPYNKREGSQEKLKNTQYHDQIKTEYCNENNIELLRIPYWEKNNIEKIIDQIILCNKSNY